MTAVEIALAFTHVIGWATYVGGTIVMELAWRPAQDSMPPAQINEACQRMGWSYRWLALTALALIAATGVGRLLVAGSLSITAPVFRWPLTLSASYGRTMLALVALWCMLVTLVVVMAVVAHPALHVRMSSGMTDEERQTARATVKRAIRRMDALLRAEIVVALLAALLGASLPFGGML